MASSQHNEQPDLPVSLPDFDDEPTVIQVRGEVFPEEPPALPMPLLRSPTHADRAWLGELPRAARRVLETARRSQPDWPLAPRIVGAVATPNQKIPSLRRGRRTTTLS